MCDYIATLQATSLALTDDVQYTYTCVCVRVSVCVVLFMNMENSGKEGAGVA